jgi:hypothetical protein
MEALHLFDAKDLLGDSPTQIDRSQEILYAGSTAMIWQWQRIPEE